MVNEEVIRWRPAFDFPEDEMNEVLLAGNGWTAAGYRRLDGWWVNGAPYPAKPLFWAPMPKGPA